MADKHGVREAIATLLNYSSGQYGESSAGSTRNVASLLNYSSGQYWESSAGSTRNG